MDAVKIYFPCEELRCSPDLPSSKSISNRMLIIRHLARKPFQIHNLSASGDTIILQKCLENINKKNSFDTGDCGTAFRFLTALFAITPGTRSLDGSLRMRQRPVGPLVDALRNNGSDISYLKHEGFPPLLIKGGGLTSRSTSIDASFSSQYISAMALIGPFMGNGLNLNYVPPLPSEQYVLMTLHLIRKYGSDFVFGNNNIRVNKCDAYKSMDFTVENDWSAAAFWYGMALLSPHSEIILKGLQGKTLQGDAIVVSVFEKYGIHTSFSAEGIQLSGQKNQNTTLHFDMLPNPDLFPAMATAFAASGIPFVFTGIRNLKYKESDRAQAMKTELAKAGICLNVDKDTVSFDGHISPHPNDLMLDSHNDHRIAMALAALSLKHRSVSISRPGCVAKSYPGFWNDLSAAGFVVVFVQE